MVEEACSNVKYSLVTSWTLYSKCKNTAKKGSGHGLRPDSEQPNSSQKHAMTTQQPTIIYTLTDEAPRLATGAFLPVVQAFAATAGVKVETSDISVATRILGSSAIACPRASGCPTPWPSWGKKPWSLRPTSSSCPTSAPRWRQLIAAIKELQGKGYAIPDYPENPTTDEEKDIKARYAKCLGSAVNPVLREGNSDRRAPAAVKNYAKKHPHSMGEWKQWSQTHCSHMHEGDFYHGEKSMTLDKARDVKMVLETKSGQTVVLKEKVKLLEGEIIDSMFMSKKALCEFYERELKTAKRQAFCSPCTSRPR